MHALLSKTRYQIPSGRHHLVYSTRGQRGWLRIYMEQGMPSLISSSDLQARNRISDRIAIGVEVAHLRVHAMAMNANAKGSISIEIGIPIGTVRILSTRPVIRQQSL